MADVGIGFGSVNTAAIGSAVNSGAYATTVLMLYLFILFGALALVAFILYKKTFNIKVSIIDNTKGGIVFREDYRGKLVQVRPGEFRFKIWNAKRYHLRYNQESFSTDDLYYEIARNGKMIRKLLMTFDSEGQLVAVRVSEMVSKVPVIDPKTKKQELKDGIPVFKDVTSVKAHVKQVDVSWYYKELDKANELFDYKGFWDKNGYIILVIVMILTLGVFGYTAYKLSEAATKMGDVVGQQGELIKMIESTRNITSAPPATGGFQNVANKIGGG